MNELARMIYRQWLGKEENSGKIDWEDYDEAVGKIHDFLDEEIAENLEKSINRNVWKVQENSFIAGFGYACKCFTDGEIDLKGGVR